MNGLIRAVAVAAALAVPTAALADTIKVGLIAPFSGAFAIWGDQFQKAVEAFQSVNGTEVDGTTIEVIYRDSGGPDPAKARQLAEELILREEVRFLAGFAFTPNALAVADLITEAEIPTVIMNAATASIVRQSDLYVRASMTLPQQTAPMAQWAADNGYKRVYTLVADYGPGHDAEGQFIKTFTAAGGEIVDSVRVPLATTDFAPFLERVLQEAPDGLFVFMPAGPPSIGVINGWDERGLKAAGIALFGTGETQEVYLGAIGDSALGAITSNTYGTELDNSENQAFLQVLHDLYGPDYLPDIASVGAWDGMRLIYDAVAELGPDADGQAYIDFMRGRSFASPRGPVTIDAETRDIIQNMYIREVVQTDDGRLVNETIGVVENVRDPWKDDNPE
ncbi:MAG: ABC transporter substrate-binding protein [Alphaproteobacteria bacterium]